MEYSYIEIQGDKVCINELNIARAKSIALVALNNSAYIINPIFIKRKDGAEVILITLDIEIYQNPLNGIEEREDIAIICHIEDEDFPEVYALRSNFQLGLPHTSLRITDYPVSLCVTEQRFQEVKHRFNPFEFVESIRQWLTLTSQNKLHAENQPLEPFFFPKGFIVIPELKKIDVNNFHIEKYSSDSDLYKIQAEQNNDEPYFCIPIKADETISGYIRKQPQFLRDLLSVVSVNGVDVSTFLSKKVNIVYQYLLSNQNQLDKKIAICCFVPIKRHATDVKSEYTDTLFFVTKKTIKEIGLESEVWGEATDKKTVVQLIGKSFTKESFENLSIELYALMPDFSKETAATYNNIKLNNDEFTLIGVGALGSQVLSLFARMGYGYWTIIDYDTLYPHNLARHVLSRDAVGCSKVEKLSEYLNFLVGDTFCKSINSNFIKIHKDKDTITCLKKSKAIIDISTSIAVGRLLARDYSNEIATRRISTFLNPTGSDLVILAEDLKRNYRLDFLEMEYYRFIYKNEKLHKHLLFDNEQKVRYIRNSCREITSRISQTDVSMHASICAKALKHIVEHRDAAISIWSINSDDYTVEKYTIKPTKWKKMCYNEWKIYFNYQLLDEMQSLRLNKLPKETGGVLLGSVDMERKIIYIYDTIPAPEDSNETISSFERGKQGVIDKYQMYQKVTDNQIQYLGEWHSHPKGCSTNPSSLDMNLFTYLSENLSRQGYPAIMSIIGDNSCNFILS